MNPEQPSREQIEARITALLLGELPAAEAELLRWTISQDAELQKLHDQLKLTIGFVREAMKNPVGASVERETSVKLPQERRQTLLAHFKTARPQPQPPQKLFWLQPIKAPSLISVLAAIVITALLAAMLLPLLDTGMTRGTLGRKLSKLTVHEIQKASLAPRQNSYAPQGYPPSTGEDQAVALNMQQIPRAVNEWKLETGKASSPNAGFHQGISAITPTPAPIALPKTESSQAESAGDAGTVYSQSVVGYINASTRGYQEFAKQLVSPSTASSSLGSSPERQPAPKTESLPSFAFSSSQSAANTASHFANRKQSQLATSETVPSAEMPSPPPASAVPPGIDRQTGLPIAESTPPAPPMVLEAPEANGVAPAPVQDMSKLGGEPAFASRENQNAAAVNEAVSALVPPRLRQQYGERSAMQPPPSAAPPRVAEQVTPIPAAPSAAAPAQVQAQTGSSITESPGVSAIQPAPVVGPYVYIATSDSSMNRATNFGELSAAQPSMTGITSFGGGGTGGGGGTNAVPVMNDQRVLSWSANNLNLQVRSKSLADNEKVVNGPLEERESQNGLQNVQNLNFPGGSTSEDVTNAVAINEAQNVNNFGLLDADRNRSTLTTREEQNAKKDLRLKFDDKLAGVAPTPTLGPLPSRESPNANAVIQNSDSLHYMHNGAINPATGLPEVAGDVPVVGEAPVTGRLFVAPAMPSPRRSRQESAEEETKWVQIQGHHQPVETPPSYKEADIPLRRPQPGPSTPQPEIQTLDNAFSTFSLNVSDVSFKLAMASLQKGQMPDPASIRSEEFINAFDYHDPEPLQGEPLAFVAERAGDPFAQERDLLRFSVKAAAAGRQDGRALNLVLLLDTSGSMERSDRVAIIREALRVLSAQLQPQDVVSVVTFARTARLWADGVPGDQAGATLDKVGSITPEGGTNLEEAMRLAYETALRHFIAGGMNRVVMLTDGAANLGNVDPQTLTQRVDWERRQGIALDCFGIGWDDYNDDLLAQLTSNGDGRYAFINSPDEAATEFAAKLAGALQVAAEDVKVQVEFNPSRVTAWRQIGYAKHQLTKEQFRDNSVAAGAIAAREAGNALYVIEINPDGQGPIATVRVRYRVPGTQDVRERSWLVDYTGAAPDLAQSSSAMRLAASAAEISEWMADSPFAQDVTPDELLNYLSGVPQFYGTDERPKQLEWMIREAKSVSGK